MTDIDELVADLRDEQSALDDVVAPLSDHQWQTLTPSPGWTVADQIGHLSYFDAAAVLACEDPGRFRSEAAKLRAAADIDALTLRRGIAPVERLAVWRANRDRLVAVSSTLEEGARCPMVRAADGSEVLRDGAPDGVLGPRTRCVRCHRGRSRCNGSIASCRPTRVQDPAMVLRQPWTGRSRRRR